MKLLKLCEYAGLSCPEHLEDIEVCGVTASSEKVKNGYVFVCINGRCFDGHRYIDDALEKGAVAVIIENKDYQGKRTVFSGNSRKTLSLMLDAMCDTPSKKMRFIGVTGTNGKTSVSTMLKNILDAANIPCGLIGTVKCVSLGTGIEKRADDPLSNMTTPDPEQLYPMLEQMAEDGVEYVIMEATSHALFYEKLAPIEFDIGVFTNLTQDHLDFHPSMEEYFKAKTKLFEKSRLALVNSDDIYGRKIQKFAPCTVKTCSVLSENSDFFAKNIKNMGVAGVEYTLKTSRYEFLLNCTVPGTFSVMNSLQAASCALELGIDKETVQNAFKNFGGVSGRLERVALPDYADISVFIDYAHTPDAIENLLQSAKGFRDAGQRIVLLFGCGGDRDKTKRAKMGKIACELADFVIVTSDNSRSEHPMDIISDILCGTDGKDNYITVLDRKKAIEYAIAKSLRGDIILLAGKGHERYEINADGRSPFDERAIVLSAFEKYFTRNRED